MIYRISKVEILTEKGGSVIIELQDGTQSVAVKEPEGGGHFITKDFWKLYYPPSSPPILTMTDGTIITFGKKKGNKRYATQIKRNNNVINIRYMWGAINTVTYYNEGTEKTIYFNYNIASRHLQSISWGPANNQIFYDYSNEGKTLATVTFPEGDKWSYQYRHRNIIGIGVYQLQDVYTPTGGTISYTLRTFIKGCPIDDNKWQISVAEKTVTDGNFTETWNYNYGRSSAVNGDYTTIVEQNSGRITNYIFYGHGTEYNGDCYKYGLPQLKTVTEAGLTKTTQYTWDKLPNYISQKKYRVTCVCSQNETYVPVLTSKITNVDGTSYTTSYPVESYDYYGNPQTIVESGNTTRTTRKTYWYNTDRNMVKGFEKRVTIEGDSDMPGTFSSSYEYHTANENYFGKLKKATEFGVVTQYGYDQYGNLDWIKDANNHNLNP